MKIICRKRAKGKTTELIKLCFEMNQKPNNLTYILCPTRNDAYYIQDMARKMELNIPFPISIFEYMESHWGGTFIKNFLVDDIDRCLFEILKSKIHNRFNFPIATLSEEFFENFELIKEERKNVKG